ncbi:hypothetical protein DQW77_07710 [Roseovarius sp. TE539]|nr:hypothetical protein DQW77_07710 [Roseovarius sp. TE539]
MFLVSSVITPRSGRHPRAPPATPERLRHAVAQRQDTRIETRPPARADEWQALNPRRKKV